MAGAGYFGAVRDECVDGLECVEWLGVGDVGVLDWVVVVL